LDKDKNEYLTENQSQLRKSDEANEEENYVIQPAPIPPCHRVYKQSQPMCHSDVDVHDNGTDDSYNNELIAASLAPQGVLTWGQLRSGHTAMSIYSLVI
jgi:hypothetical protein